MKIVLKEYLNSVGKSQYWLAKETGIAASSLSRICNNQTNSIDFAIIDKICTALDCTTEDIFKVEKYSSPIYPTKKGDSI